jgi:hypothetical protein
MLGSVSMRDAPDGVDDDELENEPIDYESALSPYKVSEWQHLSPGERLSRAWKLRTRLVSPEDAHDRKLFPAP